MEDFKKLRDKYPTCYEYEMSRNRVMVSLIDIEALGYEVACIVSLATIHGQLLNDVEVSEKSILELFGIDEYSLEIALERANSINLLTCSKSEGKYSINISRELLEELREEVAYRRVYPQLLKRDGRKVGEVND